MIFSLENAAKSFLRNFPTFFAQSLKGQKNFLLYNIVFFQIILLD